LPGQFSREQLAAKASPQIRELVRKTGRFLTFQCHPRYGNAHRAALKSQLTSLSKQTELNILLTPIGRIYSFNDGDFLESFAHDLGGFAHYLPDSATIWDIAYVLSAADLFCGTSLHGVITSLAYGVPFVSLENADSKIANNIKTWGLTETVPASRRPSNLDPRSPRPESKRTHARRPRRQAAESRRIQHASPRGLHSFELIISRIIRTHSQQV
jgi:polysaccharide pyruvyl transferase WcaK-like protein